MFCLFVCERTRSLCCFIKLNKNNLRWSWRGGQGVWLAHGHRRMRQGIGGCWFRVLPRHDGRRSGLDRRRRNGGIRRLTDRHGRDGGDMRRRGNRRDGHWWRSRHRRCHHRRRSRNGRHDHGWRGRCRRLNRWRHCGWRRRGGMRRIRPGRHDEGARWPGQRGSIRARDWSRRYDGRICLDGRLGPCDVGNGHPTGIIDYIIEYRAVTHRQNGHERLMSGAQLARGTFFAAG